VTIAETVVPLNTQNGWDREPAIAIERRLVRHWLDKALYRDERLHEWLRGLLSRKTTGGPERCLRRGEKIAKLIGQIKSNEAGIAWLYHRLEQLNGRLAA
jgi:hypothetical protein